MFHNAFDYELVQVNSNNGNKQEGNGEKIQANGNRVMFVSGVVESNDF